MSAPPVLVELFPHLDAAQRKTAASWLAARIEAAKQSGEPRGLYLATIGYLQYGLAMEALGKARGAELGAAEMDANGDAPLATQFRALVGKADARAAALLQASDAALREDVRLTPGQSRSLYALARNALWQGQAENAFLYARRAAAIDARVRVDFVGLVRSVREYKRAAGGDGSPGARAAEALLVRAEAEARADRARILALYANMERLSEAPAWLRTDEP